MSFIKYIFLVIIFALVFFSSFAQTNDVNSLALEDLQQELYKKPIDKRKIEIYNEIAKRYIKIDIRVTDSLAQIALDIAQKIDDKDGLGTAWLRKAQAKHEMPDILASLNLAKKSKACFEATNNHLGIFQAESHILSEELAVPLIANLDFGIKNVANRYISISEEHQQMAKQGKVLLDSTVLAKNYQNIAISYFFLKKQEEEAKYKELSIDYGGKSLRHFEASYYLQKGAVFYSNYRLIKNKNKLNEAKDYYKKAIDIFKKEQITDECFIALGDFASIHFYLGLYREADSLSKQTEQLFSEVKNRYKKGILYQNIGAYHLQLGDIEQGQKYTKQAAQYADINPQIYLNLAFVYLSLKEFDKASSYLFKKLKLEDFSRKSINYAYLLYGRGLYFQHSLNSNDYESSINYLNEAANFFKSLNKNWWIKAKYQLGVSYTKNKEYEKGKNEFLAIINQLEQQKNTNPEDLVLYQNALGELYTTQREPDIDAALLAYQKAINFSLKKPKLANNIDINSTPSINSLKLTNFALAPITSKGRLLIEQYELAENKNIKQLELAISTLELGVQVIDTLRYDFSGSYNGIQKMNDDFFSVFDYLMKGYTLMAKASNNLNVWNEKAFELTEKSRAYLLWHSIAKRNFKTYDNLSDKDIENIYALNSFQGRKHSDLDMLSKERKQNKVEEYESLKKSNSWVLDYFPKNNQSVSISDTRNLIANNQAIIKYYVVDTMLYTFLISKDIFKIYKQPLSLITSTAHCLDTLVRRHPNLDTDDIPPSKSREEEQRFVAKSYQLYQMILEKPLKELTELSSNINRLIVIPVDSLQHISFDFLITEPYLNNRSTLFKEQNYLIKKYAISVVSSVKILEELNQIDAAIKSSEVAIFAPSYSNGADKNDKSNNQNDDKAKDCKKLFEKGVDTLDFTEPRAIKEVFGVAENTYWEGKTATKQTFKEYTNNKDLAVVYCSMHGCVDDNPKNSRLLFADASSYDDTSRVLLLSEIHRLNINAKLIVLSACETGIGLDNSKSEGFSSVAKNFQGAGCPSIVMSRWNVRGNAITLHITKVFSENIKKGLPVDVALQEAKKSLFEQNYDDEAFLPYYWSVLVALGRSNPVFKE